MDQPTKKVVDRPPDVPTARVPRAEGDATRRAPGVAVKAGSTLGSLQPGTRLLEGCTVIETYHPHETEHPGLFLCHAPEGKVMVKVAPLRHPPKRELWDKIAALDHKHVLQVHRTEERQGLYYEVQEFCEGGALSFRIGSELISPDWIENTLVPSINEGLRYLHAQGIVHRDVKPANIFLREHGGRTTVVLGDFDISSVLESGRTSRDTSRAAGTWLYAPPEGFPRFVDDEASAKAARVTRKADYYSLGITIIELLTGTTSLHACDLPDLFDFYLGGGKVEVPNCSPRLQRLLKGLLIRNRNKRWGPDEVDRWIAGSNTSEDLEAILDDEHYSLRKAQTPYSIGHMHATDLPGLAEVLSRDEEVAKSDLLERNQLVNWIAGLDTNIAREVERDRELWRQYPDHALFRCILRLDRSRPFDLPEFGPVRGLREWLDAIVASGWDDLTVERNATCDYEILRLYCWLALKAGSDAVVTAKVGEIMALPNRVRFEAMAYLIEPGLPYSHGVSALENLRRPPADWEGGRTPHDVALQAFGEPTEWSMGIPKRFDRAMQRWLLGYLDAWMRQRGLADLADEAKTAAEKISKNDEAAFDSYLRRLNKGLPKPKLVFVEADLNRVCVTQYGARSATAVRYETRGPGIPFGAVRLKWAPEGLSLTSFTVAGRQGAVQVELNSRAGVAVSSRPRKAAIELAAGNFTLDEDRSVFLYQVPPPKNEMLRRVVLGAAMGAGLVGGCRLIAMLIIGGALLPTDFNYGDAMENSESFPYANYLVAFLLVGAFLYLAFHIWLNALRRSHA